MTEDKHIIEIDSIVLNGVAHLRPRQMATLIETEVQKALRAKNVRTTNVGASEGSIAAEVGQAVAESVIGGRPSV